MSLYLPEIANRELSDVARHARHMLEQVVPMGINCALIGSPEHGNVGDSAIWLGQRMFLQDRRATVRYSCSDATFDEAVLRRAMPSGIVYLQGGGNWGTLWPAAQAVREQVLEQLHDYVVVQLPQSIYYEDAASLERTRALVQAHPAFTLMVRDRASFDIGVNGLGAYTLLCPDSALLLEGTLHRHQPDVDCLILARTDKERLTGGLSAVLGDTPQTVATVDWLEEPRTWTHAMVDVLARRATGRWAGSRFFQAAMVALWDRIALERLDRGCRVLSRGHVVVTDRLHAHILSTMLGIPNVVLDNVYGKVGNFMDAWMQGNPLCRHADSVSDAAQIASEFLAA